MDESELQLLAEHLFKKLEIMHDSTTVEFLKKVIETSYSGYAESETKRLESVLMELLKDFKR